MLFIGHQPTLCKTCEQNASEGWVWKKNMSSVFEDIWGWAEIHLNPLFNPKSVEQKLWALLLPINGSGLENPMWLLVSVSPEVPVLPPALSSRAPGAQQLSVGERQLCHSVLPGLLHATLSQTSGCWDSGSKLTVFDEFYQVSFRLEWSFDDDFKVLLQLKERKLTSEGLRIFPFLTFCYFYVRSITQ